MARRNETGCGVPGLLAVSVRDHRTGKELLPWQWEALAWSHLDHARQCQNAMIRGNLDLPERDGGFGNEWARRNIRLVSLPHGFRNLSHQNRVNQCETARVLLAWKARERVADAIDGIGWDAATYETSKRAVGGELDRNLFTNVLDHGGHFAVPTVRNVRFPYDQSNNNSCRGGELDPQTGTIVYRRMAVADRFVDIALTIPGFAARYTDAVKVSRPVMRRDDSGQIVFDVTVFTANPPVEDVARTGHVVGFDLNADWHGGITGARLCVNGNVGRELVAGTDARRQQDKLARLHVEYERCLKKLKHLMPWQRPSDPDNPAIVDAHPKWKALYGQSLALRDKMYRIKNQLDWQYAHDIISHARTGELIAVEKLDSFDNAGRYEFRHGHQLDCLDHVAARHGKRVVKVNPAYTSHTCPWCQTRIKGLGRERSYQCPSCHRTVPRDYGAAVNIARRGCSYLGHKRVQPTPPKGYATPKRPKLTRKR